jgi:hypothetical protein
MHGSLAKEEEECLYTTGIRISPNLARERSNLCAVLSDKGNWNMRKIEEPLISSNLKVGTFEN